jgi:uncharacterized protein (TIGR03083 family)
MTTHALAELRTLGALYEQTRQRVVGLVRDAVAHDAGADTGAASVPVPACAGWRVRDVIAHLSGLATDIESGNLAGAATDAWTAAQVDARRSLSVDDVLAESDEVGPKLASFLDDFPGRYGAQVVADVAVHEQDIRGALRRPGARDSAAITHCLDFLLATFVGPGARALGLTPLQIDAGTRPVVVGASNDTAADPTEATQTALATWSWPPDGSEETAPCAAGRSLPRLEATPFELVRAFTGRRSVDQVHRLGWTVDPAPYDALFGLWPFTPQLADLVE